MSNMFEQILLQATTSSEALTGMVTAVATAVITIGGLLGYLLPKIKSQNTFINQVKEVAIAGSQTATFAARGVLENKTELQTGIDAVLALGPAELKAYVEKNKDNIIAAKKEIELKQKQFERLIQMVPKEGQIDLVENFPR